jgi:endonuclease III
MAAKKSDDGAARLAEVLTCLEKLYPDATCELNWKDAYQLVAATILSAQCTDDRVNQVTPALFKRYPDAKALAEAEQEDVEKLIKSTGFFRNKAKSLIGMAQKLVEDFDGVVPRTLEQATTLPGVARKTANVVIGTAYKVPTGVVVDTHVHRLAQRLGLTTNDDPVKIERDLMAVLPEEKWIEFSHRIIWHGRRVCDARTPECHRCPMPCPSRLDETTVDWASDAARVISEAAVKAMAKLKETRRKERAVNAKAKAKETKRAAAKTVAKPKKKTKKAKKS